MPVRPPLDPGSCRARAGAASPTWVDGQHVPGPHRPHKARGDGVRGARARPQPAQGARVEGAQERAHAGRCPGVRSTAVRARDARVGLARSLRACVRAGQPVGTSTWAGGLHCPRPAALCAGRPALHGPRVLWVHHDAPGPGWWPRAALPVMPRRPGHTLEKQEARGPRVSARAATPAPARAGGCALEVGCPLAGKERVGASGHSLVRSGHAEGAPAATHQRTGSLWSPRCGAGLTGQRASRCQWPQSRP